MTERSQKFRMLVQYRAASSSVCLCLCFSVPPLVSQREAAEGESKNVSEAKKRVAENESSANMAEASYRAEAHVGVSIWLGRGGACALELEVLLGLRRNARKITSCMFRSLSPVSFSSEVLSGLLYKHSRFDGLPEASSLQWKRSPGGVVWWTQDLCVPLRKNGYQVPVRRYLCLWSCHGNKFRHGGCQSLLGFLVVGDGTTCKNRFDTSRRSSELFVRHRNPLIHVLHGSPILNARGGERIQIA